MKPTLIFKVAQVIARIGTTLLFDLKVFGVHRVPKTGGVLLISNHQSYLDPVLLGVRLPRPLSYLAKSELFKKPAFSWLIRKLGAFPIRQGAGDVGAMKETIARLQEGHVLTIFPEGTRTETGELGPIEPGVALVIRKARVKVVPVIILGAFEAWPLNQKLFRPAPIKVLYGNPIVFPSLDRAEIVKTIDATFRDMITELKELGHRPSQ